MQRTLTSGNTTVVDVTYLCNATCRYCQWGNHGPSGRAHREINEVLLPKETLNALGTERLVLSGGEPRTRPDIETILRYYRTLVRELIVITNGYGLDRVEAQRLLQAGATGITVSLDSLEAEQAMKTRMTPPKAHSRIISNLEEISGMPVTLEIGINSVVSHPTANWRNARGLLEFGNRIRACFVKFQPVFDDGYVGRNAPELKLGARDIAGLQEIATRVDSIEHPETNPRGFWLDLLRLMRGESLEASRCGLGPRHSMVTGNHLGICYWLDPACFGEAGKSVSAEAARVARVSFETSKLQCKVGFQCFCTQSISHLWS